MNNDGSCTSAHDINWKKKHLSCVTVLVIDDDLKIVMYR